MIIIGSKAKKIFSGNHKAIRVYYGNTKVWSAVEPLILPTISGTLTYTGSRQYVTSILEGYDSSKMTLGGTQYATNAGSYNLTVTPKSGYYWDDAGTDSSTKTIPWSIGKAVPTLTVSKNTVTLSTVGAHEDVTITTNSSGSLSASSNNTSIATASAGSRWSTKYVRITCVAAGETEATVTVAATTNYEAKSVTIDCIMQV